MIQENYNFDSTSPQLPCHNNKLISHLGPLYCFSKYADMFFIIILDFVTLGFPILLSLDNITLRPSKPPRLKLHSKCFSPNPLSPILITVCLDAYDLDFPLTFEFAVSSTLRESVLAFSSLYNNGLRAFTKITYVRLKRYTGVNTFTFPGMAGTPPDAKSLA